MLTLSNPRESAGRQKFGSACHILGGRCAFGKSFDIAFRLYSFSYNPPLAQGFGLGRYNMEILISMIVLAIVAAYALHQADFIWRQMR